MKTLAGIILFLLCTNTVLEYVVFPMILHVSVNIVFYFILGIVVLVVWHVCQQPYYKNKNLVRKALRESRR